MTKLAPTGYDPAATCPTWDAFLARIMGGNAGVEGYLQRAVGYSLTGVTRE
jgi:putative DNA primase/helicase